MLQQFSTAILRGASPCVLETERLILRRPILADVKAIARLANDRRIAENTRRLPHPYSQQDAVEFVRYAASEPREIVFLIEHDFAAVGMVGLILHEAEAPELGYWLGVDHWGRGFGTEAARAAIRPDELSWVVVGDASVVRPQLEGLGLPIEVVTP